MNSFTDTDSAHLCYLLCPELDMNFKMNVVRDGEDIVCGPVEASGEGELTDETRDTVEIWARDEAVRVLGLNSSDS